jgi:hypothetical protein
VQGSDQSWISNIQFKQRCCNECLEGICLFPKKNAILSISLLFSSLPYFFLYTAPKFEQPNNKIGRISIDIPQTILITIETHGKGVLNSMLIALF